MLQWAKTVFRACMMFMMSWNSIWSDRDRGRKAPQRLAMCLPSGQGIIECFLLRKFKKLKSTRGKSNKKFQDKILISYLKFINAWFFDLFDATCGVSWPTLCKKNHSRTIKASLLQLSVFPIITQSSLNSVMSACFIGQPAWWHSLRFVNMWCFSVGLWRFSGSNSLLARSWPKLADLSRSTRSSYFLHWFVEVRFDWCSFGFYWIEVFLWHDG